MIAYGRGGALETVTSRTGIFFSEQTPAALAAAPVDGYGVGTSVVTGSGVPTAALVGPEECCRPTHPGAGAGRRMLGCGP